MALKCAPERFWASDAWKARLESNLLAFLQSDRIPVVENGVRGIGYLFEHCVRSCDGALPVALVVPFAKAMNHSSNDVKLLVATMATHLSKVKIG